MNDEPAIALPAHPAGEAGDSHGSHGSYDLPSHGRPPSRNRQRILIIGLLAVGIALAFVGRTFRPKPPLPILGRIPSFALTDQAGAPFTPNRLAGKVWIADFIFTHCTASCPKLTARLKELDVALQHRGKGGGAELVSFSVDPDNDTPPVLAAYAQKAGADPARWSFVTGPSEDVQKVIVEGFKMTAEREDNGTGQRDILHGNWFVVGDPLGNIRGYYRTETDEEMKTLIADVIRLERESGS